MELLGKTKEGGFFGQDRLLKGGYTSNLNTRTATLYGFKSPKPVTDFHTARQLSGP